MIAALARIHVGPARPPVRLARGVMVVLTLVVMSALAAWVADAWLIHLMLDQTASRAADEVQLGLLDRVSPADFEAPFTPDRLEDLSSRLDPVLTRLRTGRSAILRVNVIARDGTILYSDLPAVRGRTISPSDHLELSTALAGSVGAGEETLKGEENRDLRPLYESALEVYVPVRLGGEIVGAYEIYQDVGPLRNARWVIWGGLVGVWCLVLGMVYLLAAYARRAPNQIAFEPSKAAAPSLSVDPSRRVRLTRRELEVLRLMATSHTNRDIAVQLVVSEETIRSHVKNILHKLGQPDRTQAVLAAVRSGLVELPREADGEVHPIG